MQVICGHCGKSHGIPDITDLDLPPARRAEGNLWKAKYYVMRAEVVNANKGIKRLKKQIELMKGKINVQKG